MKASINGLYAITPDTSDTEMLLMKCRQALSGGTSVLQYRNKLVDVDLRLIQARALQTMCQDYNIPLIINDDIELAYEVGAAGVHLGKDDATIVVARVKLGTAAIIGVSCYDQLKLAESAVKQGADYVAFGSLFPSSTKPNTVCASLALFEATAKLGIPRVAIGGIDLNNGRQVVTAGTDAIAVISALFDAADIRSAAMSFSALFSKS
ncbi:thiamine phosphate synthase [Chitinivorax sp. B]|uniref:thiamine phosphate synthase n=1 Tax=Chitinivorax sp. B TaxID=2502235 RepID=UPI0010F7A4E0|nr:thiamine phosphate synthase [Chitinivorax sp. B]